jgi:hypothetical protein
MILQELPLELLLGIQDQLLWISGQAEGGFQWRRGQKGLRMGDVCIVVG